MDKLYLIFLSSTFTDLEQERNAIAHAIRKMGHAPMGMEGFPASGEKQMDYIRRTIDKCDYYVLIIGGRYGSLTKEGISYTEAEYNYALEKGLPILAFVHDAPEDLPNKHTDSDSEMLEKLAAFRQKVENSYLVERWNEHKNLPALVVASIAQAIGTQPAIGWVRGNTVASAELTAEQNALLKKNSALKAENERLRADLGKNESIIPDITDIADLDDDFTVERSVNIIGYPPERDDFTVSFREIFLEIASFIESGRHDDTVRRYISELYENEDEHSEVESQSIDTMRIQFEILGLISYQSGIWKLTQKGKKIFYASRLVRKPKIESDSSSNSRNHKAS
ncbi:MAG: DUF4062 domain-containing protein [Candidatus Tokpelaia sp.]|nr:MAG: DUF4062 domain-containing protein [Candidatus Tokpelaia sp.]KAA6206942.1 MAG: DUF4062 domain-containing protein [Candidatus Tokpelaia sp.]